MINLVNYIDVVINYNNVGKLNSYNHFILLLIAIIMLLLTSTISRPVIAFPSYDDLQSSYSPVSQNVLTPSKAVFLEHSIIANGTVIRSPANYRIINFPNYWFNENTKQLYGNIDFLINDTLILIYGDSITLTGNFGAGTGNKLFGVYSFPVHTDDATIYSVDTYGTVTMMIDDRQIQLKPSQTYQYSEKETLSEGNSLITITYYNTFTNRGLIDKNNIQTQMVL